MATLLDTLKQDELPSLATKQLKKSYCFDKATKIYNKISEIPVGFAKNCVKSFTRFRKSNKNDWEIRALAVFIVPIMTYLVIDPMTNALDCLIFGDTNAKIQAKANVKTEFRKIGWQLVLEYWGPLEIYTSVTLLIFLYYQETLWLVLTKITKTEVSRYFVRVHVLTAQLLWLLNWVGLFLECGLHFFIWQSNLDKEVKTYCLVVVTALFLERAVLCVCIRSGMIEMKDLFEDENDLKDEKQDDVNTQFIC